MIHIYNNTFISSLVFVFVFKFFVLLLPRFRLLKNFDLWSSLNLPRLCGGPAWLHVCASQKLLGVRGQLFRNFSNTWRILPLLHQFQHFLKRKWVLRHFRRGGRGGGSGCIHFHTSCGRRRTRYGYGLDRGRGRDRIILRHPLRCCQ